MTVSDVLALCEQGQCVMLEPRERFDPTVRGVMLTATGMRAVYSLEAVQAVFVAGGMNEDIAAEWVAYNVEPPQCAGWPVFVSDED